MLYAEQKARELRREIGVTDECLAEVQPLIGRPRMSSEAIEAYNNLLAERARLFGELEAVEIELLRGPTLAEPDTAKFRKCQRVRWEEPWPRQPTRSK